VDNEVLIPAKEAPGDWKPGCMVKVRVTRAEEFDLVACAVPDPSASL